MHVETSYLHDARSRIRSTNEWKSRAAPRFYLARTAEGHLWRFRADLPDSLAAELEALCRREPVVAALAAIPLHRDELVRLLASHGPVESIGAGPAYWIPRRVVASGRSVEISAANADLLLQAHDMLRYGLTANEQTLEALPYYKSVIAGYEARGNLARASRVRIGYVEALLRSGRYDDAFSVARIAEQWLKENQDNEGYARLCTGVANAYSRLGQHQRSRDYYELAARLFEEIGDRAALAKVYLDLGNALYRLDQFEESDAMYEHAEQISREMGLTALEEQSKYNRAYLYYLRGLYTQALQGFARIREQLTSSPRHIGLCDLDEAEIYLELNLSKDAAALAIRAIEQFNQIGMRYEEAKARALYGVALTQRKPVCDKPVSGEDFIRALGR